jgi:DnaK suppressor protein
MMKKKKSISSAAKRTAGKSGRKTTARKKVTKKPVKKTVAGKTSEKPIKEKVPKKAAKKKVPAKEKISASEKREFRAMLIDMRSRLTEQIEALKKDSLQRYDSVNSEEDGTDAFERQFALTIASSENELLLEIDEALRRLDEGFYGICNICDERIEKPRLMALPFVKMCVRCKSESEKQGNVSRFGSTMNRLAGDNS